MELDKLYSPEQLQTELEEAIQAAKFRERYFGIEAYVPNPKQLEAHKSKAKTILFCGGNRSGKSTFGAIELTYAVMRNYPPYFPKERMFNRPVKAVVSSTEFPIVKRVIEPKLMLFIPRSYIHHLYYSTALRYLSRIELKDGSSIDILTSEMKNDAYESADWDIAWLDEPQQQTKYQAIRRGLVDHNGFCIFTFTPLTEPWMKDELVDKADGKFIDCFTVDIRDNKADISGNQILTEESIQAFIKSLPTDVQETRISGKFFHLKGVVYKDFCDDHIRIDLKYQYPDPVICILDPHDRQPHHIIWAYIERDDDIIVDYEVQVRCELPDLAKKILLIEQKRGYKMRKRIIDPNFGRKPASPGQSISVAQELAINRCGFYDRINDDIDLGHMIVRDYLRFDRTKPVSAVNKPKLFFNRDNVPITIRSMRNLQYEDWKGSTKDDRNPKEAQKQKEDHGADCVRYLCVSKPCYRGFRDGDQEPHTDSASYY